MSIMLITLNKLFFLKIPPINNHKLEKNEMLQELARVKVQSQLCVPSVNQTSIHLHSDSKQKQKNLRQYLQYCNRDILGSKHTVVVNTSGR